jgi:flavin-dependent dehydrogenase
MPGKAKVAIVGAGPAGARCAELLAAAGHNVTMIEKDSFSGETNVCGGVLDASFAAELDLPTAMIKKINRWICHFGSGVLEIVVIKISFEGTDRIELVWIRRGDDAHHGY